MAVTTQSVASAAMALTISPTNRTHSIGIELRAQNPKPDPMTGAPVAQPDHLCVVMSLAACDAGGNECQRVRGDVDLDNPALLAAAGIAQADVDAFKRVLLEVGGVIAAQNGFTVATPPA